MSGQSFEMKVQESFCRDNEGKKFQNLFGKYFILFFQMMKTTYGTKDDKTCISTEITFKNHGIWQTILKFTSSDSRWNIFYQKLTVRLRRSLEGFS